VLLAGLALGQVTVADAQIIPTQPRGGGQQQPQPEDTIPVPQFRDAPPVSPVGAALRSLLLPGWGQSILGRRGTGATFVLWEGITLTMAVKSAQQLDYQESIGAETVDGKRQELQDWLVLLGFNHLLAAAEAFVAAQLWDFPADLSVQTIPDGGIAAGVRVPF
jgi:hypothetical protein